MMRFAKSVGFLHPEVAVTAALLGGIQEGGRLDARRICYNYER